MVLADEGVHPAGVSLRHSVQCQRSSFDHKVVQGELQLTLVRLVDLLAESGGRGEGRGEEGGEEGKRRGKGEESYNKVDS